MGRKCWGWFLALLGLTLALAGCDSSAAAVVNDDEALILTCKLEGDEYSLNLRSGEFGKNGRRLAFCPAPEYEGQGGGVVLHKLQVSRTEAGNYLLQAEGLSHGALTYDARWQGWVSQKGGLAYGDYYSMMFSQYGPGVMQAAGSLWFNGRQGLWRIDEQSGRAETFVVNDWLRQEGQEVQLGGYCYWTDGRYFLLGDTDFFLLYDRQTERKLDLRPLLLREELVAEVNAALAAQDPLAYPQPESFAYFWQKLGRMHLYGAAEPMPWLAFAGEQAGWFKFELHYRYYSAAEHNLAEAVLPLSLDFCQLLEEL